MKTPVTKHFRAFLVLSWAVLVPLVSVRGQFTYTTNSGALTISSCGWGANGHRFMTDTAIEELPAPLKSFFQT